MSLEDLTNEQRRHAEAIQAELERLQRLKDRAWLLAACEWLPGGTAYVRVEAAKNW